MLVPFWTSLLVRTFAWRCSCATPAIDQRRLHRLGVIDRPLTLIRHEAGVILGMSQILLPFMVLPLYDDMRRVDPS